MDRSVLVVEDDPTAREMIAEFLADMGFLVYEASDGPEAIEIAGKEKPSLMLLDLRLITMSGLEVLKRVKKVSSETFVVILSGSAEENDAKQAISHGAYDYLTKPVSLSKLEDDLIKRLFPDV